MANYVANFHEALSATLTAIREAQAEMYAEANGQRQQLRDLLASMRGTARNFHDISQIVGEAGMALLDISEDMAEMADKIHESTYDFTYLPEGSYEGFVGICEECGREVRADEEYDTVGVLEYVCQHCATEIVDEVQLDTEPNTEVVAEPEQLTIDDIAPEIEIVTGPTVVSVASDVLA